MDFLNSAILSLLDSLHTVLGSYALAIIVLTVLIRLVLWPMNSAQTKSMKAMQALQPKMKEAQEKYKNDPQKMQAELMRIYSENKFNPLAGCLPLLIQLPIFIALYGALMSPEFMIKAGNESFLFIQKLHHTLYTKGGEALDSQFGIQSSDKFTSTPQWTVYYENNPEPATIKVSELRLNDPSKVLAFSPQPLIPGDPVTFRILKSDVSTSNEYLNRIERIEVPVMVDSTRELEKVTFTDTREAAAPVTTPEQNAQSSSKALEKGATAETKNSSKSASTVLQQAASAFDPNYFMATLPTAKAKPSLNWDVLVLILFYGALSWGYQFSQQKVMGASSAATGQQALLMKWMPVLFLVFMLFIPIPAGVMLYLLVTMVMMVAQNLVMEMTGSNNGSGSSLSTKPASKQTVSVKAE